MNVVERVVRTGDQAQQRLRPLAFAVGVFEKFGDDRGGSLCALLAFYGFIPLFPLLLLLLLVTILGFFGGGEHSLVARAGHSVFSQFPVVGTKLSTNIHGLHDRSLLGLVVGIAGVGAALEGARAGRLAAHHPRRPSSGLPVGSRAQPVARSAPAVGPDGLSVQFEAAEPLRCPGPTMQIVMHRWFTPRALLLHVEFWLIVAGCAAATWWQASRALDGNGLSWFYTFEWPIFAGIAIAAWWHLVHEDPEERAARKRERAQIDPAERKAEW